MGEKNSRVWTFVDLQSRLKCEGKFCDHKSRQFNMSTASTTGLQTPRSTALFGWLQIMPVLTLIQWIQRTQSRIKRRAQVGRLEINFAILLLGRKILTQVFVVRIIIFIEIITMEVYFAPKILFYNIRIVRGNVLIQFLSKSVHFGFQSREFRRPHGFSKITSKKFGVGQAPF